MRPEDAHDTRLSPQVWALFALVTIDVVSKLMAVHMLASNAGTSSGAALQWNLAINPIGLGSAGRDLVADQGANRILTGALLSVEVACALAFLARTRRLTAANLGIAGVALLLSVPMVTRLAALMDVSLHASVVLLRGAQVVVWWLVWLRMQRRLWKTGALLFAAAATGNFLSFFYPPFGIVDFIWSPPIHRAIGLGIFNIADIFWHIGIVAFAMATLTALVSFAITGVRRTP